MQDPDCLDRTPVRYVGNPDRLRTTGISLISDIRWWVLSWSCFLQCWPTQMNGRKSRHLRKRKKNGCRNIWIFPTAFPPGWPAAYFSINGGYAFPIGFPSCISQQIIYCFYQKLYCQAEKMFRINISQEFERAARGHWGIENGLHWQLDFTFGDDKNTSMAKTSAKNLQTMKKIALSILRLVRDSYNTRSSFLFFTKSCTYSFACVSNEIRICVWSSYGRLKQQKRNRKNAVTFGH